MWEHANEQQQQRVVYTIKKMFLKNKYLQKAAFVLYVSLLAVIHILVIIYIYKFIREDDGIKNYSLNVNILLNYIYLLLKIFILLVEPDTYEYNKKVLKKTYQQITEPAPSEINEYRNEMKRNFVFLIKILLSLDLQNIIFCIILKKTSNISILYNQILFSINLFCSFAILW